MLETAYAAWRGVKKMIRKVLIVEDDREMRKVLSACLEINQEVETHLTRHFKHALRLISRHHYDLVVAGFRDGSSHLGDLVEFLDAHAPFMPLIVIAKNPCDHSLLETIERHGWFYLEGPVPLLHLLNVVYQALADKGRGVYPHRRPEDEGASAPVESDPRPRQVVAK